MKYFYKFILTVLVVSMPVASIAQVVFSGRVIDALTKEGVEKAKVTLMPGNNSVLTQSDGRFSIELPASATDVIKVERIGYLTFTSKAGKDKINLTNKEEMLIMLRQNEITSGTIDVYEGRIETELKYATMPVSIVTEADIKGLPYTAVPDAVKMETGVNLLRDGVWANDISIRGLGRDNVVTLINGNRIETANNHSGRLALIDINSIERIELIKGGTSSIYGSGAMGGIVNIVTKSGFFRRHTKLTGSVGSNYSSVNNLSSANLSLQFAGASYYLNSYLLTRNASDTETPSGVLPNSSFRDKGIHVDAGLKLSDKSTFAATYENFQSPYAGIPGGYPVFPDKSKTTYLNALRNMADLTFELNGISETYSRLKARLYYQGIDREVEVIPNTSVRIPPSGTAPGRNVINVSIYPSGFHDVGGLLLQNDFIFSGTNRLVAGIDAWFRKLKTERERTQIIQILDSQGNVVSSSEVITADVPVPNSEFLSTGIFVQDQLSFMREKLFIDLSGRLDYIGISNEKTSSPLYTITNGVRNNSPTGQKVIWEESSSNDISWSLAGGTNYRFTNQLNAHANISASYRVPGLEERYQYIDLGSIVRLGNPELKPERGYFFSAGLKYWSENFNAQLEGFGNFLNNQVVEVPGTYEGRQALIKQNVGSSRIAGFDAGFEFALLKTLAFTGGASYANGEDTESGNPLPQIAPLNFRFGIKYLLPFDVKLTLNSVAYTAQYRTAPGEISTPGYAVFDAYAYYTWAVNQSVSLMVSAGAENLLDKNYRYHLSTSRGTVTSEPGRNIFLNLSLNYR